MTKFDFDIGIIGGGAAGLTVTAGAAQLGAKALLIEKETSLGGDCLHYGCVPSKTLIRTASVYHLMKNGAKFGLPSPEMPPVDFAKISERIRFVINVIQKHDSPERFCRLGARVEFGNAAFRDEHSVSVSGKIFSARHWVIATGSSPSVPPIEGLQKVSYLTNREIFTLEKLPKKMIVLGAGPIAIEMAQAFCRLGTEVHVVQRSNQILSREDKDMSDIVMENLRREGVRFHLNARTVKISESAGEKQLTYEGPDGGEQNIRADQLLVALGRDPNVGGMALENIGVDFDRKGVKVDNRLRTSQKHIYAAGDVNGAYLFTHAAGYEGGVVIGNAIFRLPRKADYTLLPWCTFTEPELASIGMNETRARAAGYNYSIWQEEFADNDRNLAEGGDSGRIKLLLDEKERPLGVQILGLHAGDLLGEWVGIMAGRVRIATIAAAVHPYPTMAEISKRVSGSVLSKKLFSNKVRKALSFFFSLQGRACAIDDK